MRGNHGKRGSHSSHGGHKGGHGHGMLGAIFRFAPVLLFMFLLGLLW